ncbi:hypothetical protein AA313_de0200962 [Arthrobotrys entomopaga]|nr:hypothetical protein AA313_de0200962 [Arthrobotrys entomopaga]
MAGKSKKQKLTGSNTASTKRTLSQSTSLSTASPILKSAFSPSWSTLTLFSSVLRGLDAQRLRCHDTTSGRLQCEYIFDKTVEVNSLTWGSLAETDKDRKKKKRKRASDADAAIDDKDDEQKLHDGAEVVIAATSNTGKIFLYSPVQAELVKTLEGGHVGPVTDFQFVESSKGVRAWSCGGNKLVEWDVKKGASIRNIAFGETINFFRTLPSSGSIICASYSTYIVDPTSPPTELTSTFSSHTSQIHTLRRTAKQHKFLSAADGDRFIYVSDTKKEKSLGSLVAKGDVTKVDTTSQDTALVAVTADGIVEVFTQPWSFQPAAEAEEGASVKRKKALTKTSEARVKIVRPDTSIVKVIDACFQGDGVLVAWVENATSVLFEKVKCLSTEGGLTISGDVVITKAKTVGIGGTAGGRSDANDIKDVSNVNLKQSHTVVIEGADMQDIGMVDAPEKPEGDDGEEGADADSDDEQGDNADDPEEQTFEDRIKALNLSAGGSADSTEKSARSDLSPMTNITVPSVDGAALVANKTVKFPNATSLTTVVTQALKTNDRALLETCLQVTKVDMIESTIQRLDSLLAADLVTQLAEIIARKPGRAGSLMLWIQKTLVNHGGHLLTLPDLVRTLASLQRVLGKRAEALPKMLALRGRLSMLVAQMKLRSMARDRLGASGDAAVVYVEGVNKDDESSSGEEEDEVLGDVEESEDEDEDSDEGMNGVPLDSASEGEEDEESEDDEDGPGIYLDREAEETDDDSTGEDSDLGGFVVDDDEVDYDSQDDGVLDDDESEEEAPKVVKKGKSSRR